MPLLIITLVPFAIALVLAMPFTRGRVPQRMQSWAAGGLMALAFASLLGYVPALQAEGEVVFTWPWVPEIGLSLTLLLDGLSLIFGLIITGVGALIVVYSGYYFDDRDEFGRFDSYLLAFAGAMLAVVLSGNLLLMFIMWELTSVTSFLLIGFKGDKYPEARQGAMQALLITGGGGLALLAGILVLGAAAGSLEGSAVFLFDLPTILALDGLATHPWYAGFAILLMIGGFTKSAQFPFHFWLPGAMSAPTPASAYLHSATMVKAGVFLFLRLNPVMGEGALWSNTLLAVGLITMLVGAAFALRQRDLKGLLAYSTISQLGAFVALVGLPHEAGIKAAMIGIMAHALYKAALFLVAGTIDHRTGTRIIDRLGGLWRQMPGLTIVAVISALSMAGVPFFFGFVAKETLIAAFMAETSALLVGIVWLSAMLTVAVAAILIWDVFFRRPAEEVHDHPMAPLALLAPGVLAFGSLTLGFLLDPVVIPLLELAVPKAFSLYLFPGFNLEFILSIGALLAGGALFATRHAWMNLPWRFPLRGDAVFAWLMRAVDQLADFILLLQGGRIRTYLAIIFGTVIITLVVTGPNEFLIEQVTRPIGLSNLTLLDVVNLVLLVVAVAGAVASVIFRNHLQAVLALGVTGYAIGGVFLVEGAPDVAMVQLLVETLLTVLVVIMLSRIDVSHRQRAIARVFGQSRTGLARDAVIAAMAGLAVFTFAYVAMINRSQRESIADYYLQEAYVETGATDTVAAILTDFRGMDTIIEVFVFGISALGLVALLAVNRERTRSEFGPEDRARDAQVPNILTPLTQLIATLVLPFALMVAVVQLLYGGFGIGDGFTAGVVAGLTVALWYVVFGYYQARKELAWFRAGPFMVAGLVIIVVNALLPVLFDRPVLAHTSLDFQIAGIKLSSSLVFEVGIALTVFGAVGWILSAIAHPFDVMPDFEEPSEER
jgi:multicomponent K+:H+ antiporter subunit A